MANLKEDNTWEQGIYQFETSDPVMGGPNGIDNVPTRQLANRTLWLKNQLAAAEQSINTNQTNANNTYATKATTLTAGIGLTGFHQIKHNPHGGVFQSSQRHDRLVAHANHLGCMYETNARMSQQAMLLQ